MALQVRSTLESEAGLQAVALKMESALVVGRS